MRGNQSGQMAINMGIVHSGEMILPRDLIDFVRGRAANSNQAPASSGGGGDQNFHFHGPASPAQMKRWFQDNHQNVGAAVRQFVRQGGNTAAFR